MKVAATNHDRHHNVGLSFDDNLSCVITHSNKIQPFLQTAHIDFIIALYALHQLPEGIVNLHLGSFHPFNNNSVLRRIRPYAQRVFCRLVNTFS